MNDRRTSFNPKHYVTRWLGHLFDQCHSGLNSALRRVRDATPLEHLRMVATALLFACGLFTLAILVVPQYDRALVLSGRTEVLSMRLDDQAFGSLTLERVVYRADADSPPQKGRFELHVASGTTLRFARVGRGPLRLTFVANDFAPPARSCEAGLQQVGTIAFESRTDTLCAGATFVVPMAAGDDPLVVALSGGVLVGEEVSQGAGPRPILLEATASLLVKHSNWIFHGLCSWDLLQNLCGRFVANSVTLSPGDSVRAEGQLASNRPYASLGFVRVDPSESYSGMLFTVAAPASKFVVQRMQGEPFTVRESLFDVIAKSPVVKALDAALIGVGIIWYFLRLAAREGGQPWRGAPVWFLAAVVCAPIANAQEALIQGQETGQGMLRSRGDRCYAVTPAHVLGSETSVVVTAPGRERGEGDVLRRIPAAPEPIGLISLRGIPLTVCPPFGSLVELDSVLRTNIDATLQLVRTDGSIDRVAVAVAAVEVETIEIRSDVGALEQGMSGGTVIIGGQPVGLLFDVTNGGHTGRVGRLDRIGERLEPHLASSLSLAPGPVPAGSVPYEILRSDSAPVLPENVASSLQGSGPGPWRVRAARRATLVIKLSAPFKGIVLDVSGLTDPPRTVEFLASRGEQGPWQSLATISVEPGDSLDAQSLPPTNLKYVLVVAYAASGRDALAIKRVSFVEN